MGVPAVLAIEHVEQSSPPAFILRRLPDGGSRPSVHIASPYNQPVEDQPNSNLMDQLRWYLEAFLEYPFPPETTRAEHILDALKHWGTQAFNALFDRRDASEWLAESQILQVRSNDAQILSWPWEALYDPNAGYVAHNHRVERRLNGIAKQKKRSKLPKDRVNILLVVARPYKEDVSYRSLARPLVELIRDRNLPAHVDILRPPTFDQLREQLRAHPGYYHVLHFDGHGAFSDGAVSSNPHQLQAPAGRLVFEDNNGEPDAKSADDLSTLLRDYAVPAVVLNACQSGMLPGSTAADPFSSVATALLKGGMRSVVAMAYSLYVSGAQEFLPAFYRRLFEKGAMSEAVRAGRQQMLADKGRVCVRGRYPLEDWLLPVLYQQGPLDFSFARQAKLEQPKSNLPPKVREHQDPYGFIGRDSALLAMERAVRRNAPAVLIQGLGGVGKTTLARGFLRWLDETGGLDGALWFDFREIRTAEYVINQTGQMFYGENFGIAPNKIALLGQALKQVRVLMVWDNFESTDTNLKAEDRAELGLLLDGIRRGKGKVIITSRSREEWLGPARRFELRLGGLDGEERWEYCETILRELGLKVDREDSGLKALMDQLSGHPLAMRVVLPKLEGKAAWQIAVALKKSIVELGLDEKEEQGKLFGALHFVERGVPEELRPLLWLVGLHEGFVDGDYLEAMARQVDVAWTRVRIDRFLEMLAAAGLLQDRGQAIYEMHPLLTSYLRSREEAPEPWQRAFVDVMGRLANAMAPKELHEQRGTFSLHGANFHFALELAGRLAMDTDVAALTQSLAEYARKSRYFGEAQRLFETYAEHHAARKDAGGEATAYHQLGMIAEEQREFAAAREWYLKSLAISEKQGIDHYASGTYHELGRIAQEQREFAAAREWYLKSLAIKERQGNLHGAASTYHQLGIIAGEQREFTAAREWYLKSLAISEKHGNLHGAAGTYHQLGMIAGEQREFAAAREWYLKSLAISEKHSIDHGAALTYHQLGMIAEEQREFADAREWYLKSLAISEKQGNLHGAASTYHQLGMIAEEQQEFAAAREWYLKSLAISEKQGNLHYAASTCGNLGNLAGTQGRFEESGQWLIRSIAGLHKANDPHGVQRNIQNFRILHRRAPPEMQQKLKAMWRDAGLGDFPE